MLEFCIIHFREAYKIWTLVIQMCLQEQSSSLPYQIKYSQQFMKKEVSSRAKSQWYPIISLFIWKRQHDQWLFLISLIDYIDNQQLIRIAHKPITDQQQNIPKWLNKDHLHLVWANGCASFWELPLPGATTAKLCEAMRSCHPRSGQPSAGTRWSSKQPG